jgi:hypothetical protein
MKRAAPPRQKPNTMMRFLSVGISFMIPNPATKVRSKSYDQDQMKAIKSNPEAHLSPARCLSQGSENVILLLLFHNQKMGPGGIHCEAASDP